VLLALALAACTTLKKDKKDDRKNEPVAGTATPPAGQDPAAPPASGDGAVLKLKGTTLLAQALYSTLGSGKNINDNNEDLFDLYSQNLGKTEGLRFGEIYPDSPSASYLLALTIIADNAARRCQDEIATGKGNLCHCETGDQAKAMMARAFPFAGFDKGEHADVTARFAELCAKNYVAAVSAIISSVGFAAKQ
jgi:hypothetical protein